MKKFFCICAICLGIAALATSCNKQCQCTTYVDGVETISTDPFDVESGKKCADYNSKVELFGITTEIKCHTVM